MYIFYPNRKIWLKNGRVLWYKKWLCLLKKEGLPYKGGMWRGTKDAIWVNKRHAKYVLCLEVLFVFCRPRYSNEIEPHMKVWLTESWVFLHPSPRFITSFLECNHLTPFLINSVAFFQKSVEETSLMAPGMEQCRAIQKPNVNFEFCAFFI